MTAARDDRVSLLREVWERSLDAGHSGGEIPFWDLYRVLRDLADGAVIDAAIHEKVAEEEREEAERRRKKREADSRAVDRLLDPEQWR